jgi:hypothetical protein
MSHEVVVGREVGVGVWVQWGVVGWFVFVGECVCVCVCVCWGEMGRNS